MALTGWLVDKSALVRLGTSPDAEEWANRIGRGLVRITTVTRLEIGYSARNAGQASAAFRTPPLSAMPVEYLTPTIEDRALEVQLLLAGKGQHRAPSIPDLLIESGAFGVGPRGAALAIVSWAATGAVTAASSVNSHALVISNSDYHHPGISDLPVTANDAQAVRRLFEGM